MTNRNNVNSDGHTMKLFSNNVKPLQNVNTSANVNILDEPTSTSSKDTILSMYKQQQPLLPQTESKTSAAFMTQFPPNLDPFVHQQRLASNSVMSTGQTGAGIQVGNNMAMNFNGTVNSEPVSNPYTMLNNRPNHFLY